MRIKSYLSIITLLTLLGLTACSETEDTSEYANWQARNTAWLAQIADSARNNLTDTVAREEGKWLILKSLNLPWDSGTPTITQDNMKDYVFVKILSSGKSTSGRVLYEDSVKMDYRGWLMPTDSYKYGLVFDQSYDGEFNPATNHSVSFTVTGVVKGWQAALQRMHVGDRWMVYIPQELAYGSSGSGSIPGYSTLRFDMYVNSLRHKGDKDWTTK